MSKIGKKSIPVPSGVDVKIDGSSVAVKGPKGELIHELPSFLALEVLEGKAQMKLIGDVQGKERKERIRQWGLERAEIKNMIVGVSHGFDKALELQGVGYKAIPKGSDLQLSLGFSHPIPFKIPQGINVKVEKNIVTISGIDKELVGHVAAKIRALKVPEPYKGHGVRYVGEVIKLKAGKKAVATT